MITGSPPGLGDQVVRGVVACIPYNIKRPLRPAQFFSVLYNADINYF